jgi:diaminobutyrate-2-oxoglutarate transaminase
VEVRGKGMIIGFDVSDGDKGKAIAGECFKNGMLIGGCGKGGEVLKFIPPLTTPKEDLQKGLEIFASAYKKVIG